MNTVVDEKHEPPFLDPDELLDRLASLLEALRPTKEQRQIELYHRVSCAVRSGRRAAVEKTTTVMGREDGLALRTRSDRGAISFAACSGTRPSNLRQLLAEGLRLEEATTTDSCWPVDPHHGVRTDRDASEVAPSPEELAVWLERANEDLIGSDLPGRLRLRALESWVEVATTVESWVVDNGFRASRSRTRAWAMVRLVAADRVGVLSPIQVASRRWRDLEPDGWKKLLQDRWIPRKQPVTVPSEPVAVIFDPESSATLVLALTRALHTPDQGEGIRVGPGWRLADDPGAPEAVFGGSFDDVGFPTRRTPLADGRRAIGRIGDRGHYRRPSFRDRPAPRPAHLVVSTPGADPPARGVIVSGLSLHPFAGGTWILEGEGAILEDGHPSAPLSRFFIPISAGDLVRRCIGAVGPARLSHRGVRTPALVFDGLRLES